MAKRVTVTFLLDDEDDHTELVDELHDSVQTFLVQAPGLDGMARDIDIDVQERVAG